MAQATTTYRLLESSMITDSVRYLRFEREDKSAIDFIPGQFVTFHIEGPEKVQRRSYSLANPPGSKNLEIACTHIEGGLASTLFDSLKPGDPVTISGPVGLLVLKEEQPARYLLVGTSTGITPYRSMLDEISKRLDSQPNLEVHVIQGVREAKDLLFEQDFLALAEKHPNFHFYACYSRADSVAKPHERIGRVQHTLEELKPNPESDLVYLCGNPNMIDENFDQLTANGFDRKSVRREKYVFSH